MYIILGEEENLNNEYMEYERYNVCLAKTEQEAKNIVDYLNKNTYECDMFSYNKIYTYSLKDLKDTHRYYHVYGSIVLERKNHVFKFKDSVIHNLDYYLDLEYVGEDNIINSNEYYNYESSDSKLPYKMDCHNIGNNTIYVDIELPLSQDKEKTINQFKMLESKIKFIVSNMAKAGVRSSNEYKKAIENLQL